MNHDDETTAALEARRRNELAPSARVLDALRRELDATPRAGGLGWGRSARLLASAVWSSCVLLLVAPSSAWQRPGELLVTAAAFGGAAALVLGVSLPGAERRLELGARRLVAWALGLGLVLALTWRAREFLPWASAWAEPAHGAGCLAHSLAGALLGSLGLGLLWRHADPFTPGWSAALLGLVGGLAGTLSVGLGCASLEGWHLLLTHGSATLLSCALVAAGARRWLAI